MVTQSSYAVMAAGAVFVAGTVIIGAQLSQDQCGCHILH